MIIIYKEPNKDGKLVFTKEELEALLEQARQEGYKEGKKDVIIPSIQPVSTYLHDKSLIVGGTQKSDYTHATGHATSKPDSNIQVIG